MTVAADHDRRACRPGVDQQNQQVRPVAGDDLDRLVDITGPGPRPPDPGGLEGVPRQDVVEHRHPAGCEVSLHIDEVADRELRQVHPIDERQVHGYSVEVREGVRQVKYSSLFAFTRSRSQCNG